MHIAVIRNSDLAEKTVQSVSDLDTTGSAAQDEASQYSGSRKSTIPATLWQKYNTDPSSNEQNDDSVSNDF